MLLFIYLKILKFSKIQHNTKPYTYKKIAL